MRSTIKKMLLALGILLSGTELGLRFVLGNFAQSALVELVDDPSLCLILGKNRSLSYTGWWGRVPPSKMESNRFGSREPRSIKNNKKQVFILGDSFTYGQGVNQEEALPAQLQTQLPMMDIWNFGVPGRDFFQFSAEMKRLSALDPDIIIVNIFANDFDLPPKTCMFSQSASWQFPVMRQCYLCRLVLFMFVKRVPEEISKEKMTLAIDEELQKMKTVAQEENIALIITFLTDESTMMGQKEKLPDTRAIIKNQHSKTIDLSYTWGQLTMNPEKYTIPNEFHLNAEGNRILAEAYAKKLNWLLNKNIE